MSNLSPWLMTAPALTKRKAPAPMHDQKKRTKERKKEMEDNRKKRKKAVSRLAKSDAESIFKVIEGSNPFSDNSGDE